MQDSASALNAGIPMLQGTAAELLRPVPSTGSGPEHVAKTVKEPREWGMCAWEIDEDQIVTGTMLLGDQRAVQAMWRKLSPDMTVWPYLYAVLTGLAFAGATLAGFYLTHVPHVWWLLGVLGVLLILTVGTVEERAARRAAYYPVLPRISRLLAVEADAMQSATPDAGLLALTRAAITHPAHFFYDSPNTADALEACAALVAAAHGTPMQATTTAILASLAERARRDDSDMWPEVLDIAQTQLDKVHAWRAAR